MSNKYKYSVLCFIVNDYEIVREIENKDDNVEYILVTDNKELKSNTWNVVYDKDLENMLPFEKCCNIKYNLFKYITTNICIYIDASIKIKDSLDQLVNDFNASNSDIALLSHPTISTFVPELQLWVKLRNYSYINANKFLDFLYSVNYDLNYQSHFQSGLSIRKNTKFTNDFQRLVLSHMYFISDENNFDKIDQLMQDFVLNTYFNTKNIFLLSLQCLNSKSLQIYKHNSNEINELDIEYNLNYTEYAYCFNQPKECYYIK